MKKEEMQGLIVLDGEVREVNNNLLIIGAGQYGAVAKEIAEEMQCFGKIAFLDDNSPLSIGKISELEKFVTEYKFAFVAIGNPRFRKNCIDELEKAGYCVPVLIHPKAYVSPTAKAGAGSVIEPMAVVQTDCLLGKGVLVCAGAVIKHNSVIGDVCYIDCNSTVAAGAEVPISTKTECGSFWPIKMGEEVSSK